jgi:hypothetical protein
LIPAYPGDCRRPQAILYGARNVGQYVVIVPSQSPVVVSFGWSLGRNADADSVGRLVRDVIGALAPAP